jgi:hypothetical protein
MFPEFSCPLTPPPLEKGQHYPEPAEFLSRAPSCLDGGAAHQRRAARREAAVP